MALGAICVVFPLNWRLRACSLASLERSVNTLSTMFPGEGNTIGPSPMRTEAAGPKHKAISAAAAQLQFKTFKSESKLPPVSGVNLPVMFPEPGHCSSHDATMRTVLPCNATIPCSLPPASTRFVGSVSGGGSSPLVKGEAFLHEESA